MNCIKIFKIYELCKIKKIINLLNYILWLLIWAYVLKEYYLVAKLPLSEYKIQFLLSLNFEFWIQVFSPNIYS